MKLSNSGGVARFSEIGDLSSFSLECKLHALTQFDSHTGRNFSEMSFFDRTGFSRGALRGKLVLDAGCGSGRYVKIAAKYEAEVIGVDRSRSVESAYDNLAGVLSAHFIQSGLSSLSLRRGIFDAI